MRMEIPQQINNSIAAKAGGGIACAVGLVVPVIHKF
jgi:hypothetical protein